MKMSISDLYASGAHKVRVSHFANIVKLALADNVITESEQKFIDRLAKNLEINEIEHKKILKNPDNYPLDPSLSHNARIERLFNLTKLIIVDKNIAKEEVRLLNRIVIGLGFPLAHSKEFSDTALFLVSGNINLDDFTRAIKKLDAKRKRS